MFDIKSLLVQTIVAVFVVMHMPACLLNNIEDADANGMFVDDATMDTAPDDSSMLDTAVLDASTLDNVLPDHPSSEICSDSTSADVANQIDVNNVDAYDCVDSDEDDYGQGRDCLGPDCDDNNTLCWSGACCDNEGLLWLPDLSSVDENAGNAEICVQRQAFLDQTEAVQLSTKQLDLGNGAGVFPAAAVDTDYVGLVTTLTFTRGETSKCFAVAIVDNSAAEGDVELGIGIVSAELSTIAPGQNWSSDAANGLPRLRIIDDDEPSASVCPDGHCDVDETCSSCFADCGPCAGECGDGACDANESCGTCASDCGACSSGATFVGNFDSGSLGSAPTGADGYSDGVAQGPRKAAYDATRAFSGTQSAKINTETGEMFFGIAAMSVPGGNLAQGDEIWRQEKFWIPSSFDFTGGQPAVKWINYAPNDGTGRVYWNLRAGGWSLISETDSSSGYLSISAPIPRDQWVTVETWMKVTAVSEPCMRLWVNGVFLGEKTTTTIARSSILIDEIRLGDYWNTGAPSNQSFWVDDLKIYSSRAGNIPTRFDSGGRRFIGLD